MDVIVEETVVVAARAEELAVVHAALDRFWSTVDGHVPPLDTTWRAQFVTAVGEIGANIVRHAHPGGYPSGPICLRLRCYRDRVEARFMDGGLPYRRPSNPPDPLSFDELDLPEGGYGLLITRATLDCLQYGRTRGGTNVWRLIKYMGGHSES